MSKKIRDFESLSIAVNTLSSEGYSEQLEGTQEGVKRLSDGKVFPNKDMLIVEHFRFEGMSDPSDNTVLFAMQCPDGTKGTLVAAYGAEHFQNLESIRKMG